MKNKLLLLLIVFSQVGVLMAQEPQIPDFKNSPMILKKDGSLGKLEKQTSEIKHKAKAMGYGGTTTYLNFTDPASPVKVGKDVVFIVKLNDAETDPESVFYLTKVQHGSKSRSVDLVNVSAFAAYGAGGKSTKKDYVKLDYEKVAPGVYKIIPKDLEAANEYAFVSTAQSTSGSNSIVYLFGTN